MSYPFTVYQRPNGHKTEHEMRHINQEDEDYFRENNIKIGMENIEDPNETIIVYAEYGETNEEPDELTYIVPKGQTCFEAMANIHAEIKELKAQV